MTSHRYSQLSLYYLAGYLLPGGLALVLAPELALRLLLSNGDYGVIMPRMAGFLMLALGILIVQFIRLEIHSLYPTAIVVRLGLCLGTIWLYSLSGDPLFITLLVIIAIGLTLTFTGTRLDARRAATRG